ncbi:thiol-activated cytolysin family protein [Cellulophaga sp. Z1A5H]|uniref:thiol-activated cytolysin family protein n=1 Tax=Cellulophaga sp. Z1A5H TaxID=2687291 RepID=UPI0013FE2C6A|nr:thiol-activated cytolysin family protein [Cellulophaga sp. Z1A5H]
MIVLKQVKLRHYLLLIIAALLSIVSCNKEEDPKVIDELETLDSFKSVIAIGNEPVSPTEEETEVEYIENQERIINAESGEEEIWKCITTTYDLKTGTGNGSGGFPLFNPSASVIYPGSLLQGKSLKNATPDVIPVKRAGGTVSYNLNNGNINSAINVAIVSKSSIQNAMNEIIAASPNAIPANFSFEYTQVQSREALAVSLGLDIKTAFTKIGGNLDFKNEDKKSRVLVKLKQSFYTMSIDLPTSLDALFDPSVTPEDLAKFVQEDNPATYISDVTYGRVYYMLIETNSSYQELKIAINGSFGAVVASGKFNLEVDALRDLKEVKINVTAFGGEAKSTIKTIGANLNELVGLLAESAKIETGLPISYVVRSVNTSEIVGVQLATTYSTTSCDLVKNVDAPIQTKHWHGNKDLEEGGVGAAFERASGEYILINTTGDKFMRSYNGELDGPFPVTTLFKGEYPFFTGDKSNATFDGIGAIVNVRKNAQEISINNQAQFLVISKNGLQYKYVNGDTWEGFTTVSDLSIEKLSKGTNPFNTGGIGAILNVYYELENEKEDKYKSSMHIFNQQGTEFSLYWSGSSYANTGTNFNIAYDIKPAEGNASSAPKEYNSLPFNTVGASFSFYTSGVRYFVIFDKSGKSYAITDAKDRYSYSQAYHLN